MRCDISKLISIIVLITFVLCSGYILLVSIDQRQVSLLSVSKLEKKHFINDAVRITDRDERYFWFLQVTDLHLSKFSDHGRSPDFLRFLKVTIPTLSPDLVLISGDITDSKSSNGQGSDQYLEEWKTYKKIVEESGVLQKVKWLDLRGNHDSFNVPNLQHPKNLYRLYSVQGRQHRQSYMYLHRKTYGTYSIIAMDACPNPGPKRPYNFFGVVSSSTIQLIQHYSHLSRDSNMTFWFGHYPTSTIVSPGYDLRAFIGRTAAAYLCGHLHTLGRNVFSMYSLQPQGYLELELGDWRDSRYYRLVAVDHDLMSFTDEKLDKWPVVLVTNPKDSSYLIPTKEPVDRISKSSHIRILAFSVSAITHVGVYIDGKYIGEAQQVNRMRPLFTIPWNPQLLMDSGGENGDQHTLEVVVKDSDGRSREIRQQFSVEGRPAWKFRYFPSLLLSGDVTHFVRVMYYTLWISLFSPIVFMRFVRYKPAVRRFMVQSNQWLIMLYNFSQNDFLFYPWILYFLYSACGPLMFGSFISGGLSLIFVHGMYVNGVYIPEALPYATEFFENLFFMLPLLVYFCRRVTHTPPLDGARTFWPRGFFRDLRHHWGIYILLTIQFIFTVLTTYMPYGLLAFMLSPCRSGLLLLAWFMHRSTLSNSRDYLNSKAFNDRKSQTSEVQCNSRVE